MEINNILVKKAKKGDGEAYISLIKEYEQVLYKVASRILYNDEDVADALQETIMTGYEKIHTLKNDSNFNIWICRILINKCNYILNKSKNEIVLDDILPVTQKANNNDFLKIELEEALNSLNKDYKLAMILYYIVGLSTREISEMIRESEGTIKSRLSRAKTILRENYFKNEGVVEYGR
ncbi:RNA polymerase sigma factor [Clostridium beijerinckii]|uniref:RNA polymerase sigma factor n=1 Tax=Clostridium beijerinckii TaxID=1520 RepID=UPI00098C12BE|nr:RNA polymerase sigma factor [Clostridium beijerinckii]NRT79792.1 RNA polymerase sigma-70 factor (ECF subfamily) [Clostridium beijerinckii]OOM49179.1 RNA polymerase sigma factor SigV [Clostridium beijerinckii]